MQNASYRWRSCSVASQCSPSKQWGANRCVPAPPRTASIASSPARPAAASSRPSAARLLLRLLEPSRRPLPRFPSRLRLNRTVTANRNLKARCLARPAPQPRQRSLSNRNRPAGSSRERSQSQHPAWAVLDAWKVLASRCWLLTTWSRVSGQFEVRKSR